MPGSVPDGWCEASLGDVAEVIAGQSPPGTTVSDWHGVDLDIGLPFIQGNCRVWEPLAVACEVVHCTGETCRGWRHPAECASACRRDEQS